MTTLENFRRQKDDFFHHDYNSPLTPEQRQNFEGLKYFEENPDLRFEVVVERFPQAEEVQIQTTTGEVQTYERYGRFEFERGGRERCADGVPQRARLLPALCRRLGR